jgi:hypothetical protein
MEIKGKTEEVLVKQIKTCKTNMQELTNSIKIPNLRNMGIDKGEEVQAKGIHNIFNKTKTENFPNLENYIPIQIQASSRTQNRLEQNKTAHDIIDTTSTDTRERILTALREKNRKKNK